MEFVTLREKPVTVRFIGNPFQWNTPEGAEPSYSRWACIVIDRTDSRIKVLELSRGMMHEVNRILESQTNRKWSTCHGDKEVCGKRLRPNWYYCPNCGKEAPYYRTPNPGGKEGMDFRFCAKGFGQDRKYIVEFVSQNTLSAGEIQAFQDAAINLREWSNMKDKQYIEREARRLESTIV